MMHWFPTRPWLISGLVSLMLIASVPATAQNLTATAQNLPGTALGSAAWGDYDGDGKPDLLLTGLTGPADGCIPLSQIFQNNNGALSSINASLPGISLGAAAWGDYDGDGDLDLALAGLTAENQGLVQVYKNESGAFVQDTDQDLVPLRYCALSWGDYDGDGDLDLLVSGMSVGGNPRTVLYRNARIDRDRLGSPLGGRPVLEEDVPNTGRLINLNQGNLAWGDVDNDGDLDLALSGFGTGGPRQAQIYRNHPAGTLTQDGRNTDLAPVSNGDLAWGDYDNDGDLDLVLSGWNGQWEATLNLYTNAAGILRENTTFSTTRVIGAVGWGDYDNDGDLDLAASGQNSASDRFAFILRNGPPGTFQTDNTQTLSGLRGGDLAWADIDTDGDLDILLSGEDALGVRKTVLYTSSQVPVQNTRPRPPNRLGTPVITSNGVSLNWNDGADNQSNASGLTYTLRIGTSPGGHNVFSGAVPTGPGNAGSSKTLQLAIPLARDTYYWAIRTIDGGYLVSEESQEDLFRVQDLVSSVQNIRALQSSAMAWGDYDNDGDFDLAISGRDADNIVRSLVYENNNGLLVENARITLQGAQDGDLDWGDFDNDGDLDLILTGGDPAGNRFTHLYLNRLESRDFALNIANVRNLPQLNNSSAAWGDYDNDGDLDLALMGTLPGRRVTGIYRNDNNALVEDTSQSLTPTDNGKLSWGDFDNDGDLDLATIGQISDASDVAVSLYQNNPTGALAPDTRSQLTGLLASSLAWGDFDNDGDLDLGITGFNPTGGLLTRLYANNGSGIFTDAGIGLTGAAASDLAWGDFDNDGDLDLALVGQAASGQILQIFRNQGGAFEQVPIDILTGLDFATITWADIDNDGDLDLASSGRTSVDPTTFPPVSRINDNLESRFNPNRNPSAPSALNATSDDNVATLSWAPGSDLGITPDGSLTYTLRVGTSPGGNEILSGQTPSGPGPVRGTTYRLRSLKSGRYFWAVQTVDHGSAVSDPSEESSFIVDTVKPVVDSVRVSPPVLTQGRRATVVIDFRDEPAGMDNTVPPQVSLQLSGGGGAIPIQQVSYSGGLWIGETQIEAPVPGGTIIVDVTGAKDLKDNEMLPHQTVLPALVGPGAGGVVNSGDGIVSLILTPSTLPTSLTQNPRIEIFTGDIEGPPSGATPVGKAYQIVSNPDFQFEKAATLAFETAGIGANPDQLSVYRTDGAAWNRLGGTFETGHIKVPLRQFGTFALFEDGGPAAGGAGVNNINFSNRVFTPGADALRPTPPPGAPPPPATNPLITSTDISFELGAQATVRIEIYNRTGRLQRVLEPGRTLNSGRHIITWDGRDGNNNIVKSGLYIVVIDAGGSKAHKTVAVVNN